MYEKRRPNSSLYVAKTRHNFCPAIDAIGVGTPQLDSVLRILRRDGRPIALARKHIRAGDNPF